MAQKGKYPSLERQWRKLMYAFYDYLPMQYKNASARDWQIRHLVWDFKDGRAYESVAEITASALVRFFGKETRNIVFACVPASSAAKNEKRYKRLPPQRKHHKTWKLKIIPYICTCIQL